MTGSVRRGPLIGADVLLGTGLGGFVDGIVLHQILQWHNMLSSVVVPLDLVVLKDLGFLVVSALLAGAGYGLIHAGKPAQTQTSAAE